MKEEIGLEITDPKQFSLSGNGAVSITMNCGNYIRIRNLSRPYRDIPCPCGKETHFLVKVCDPIRDKDGEVVEFKIL